MEGAGTVQQVERSNVSKSPPIEEASVQVIHSVLSSVSVRRQYTDNPEFDCIHLAD